MSLVDAVEAVDQKSLQSVCAAGISQSFIGGLNVPRPFHDGAAVKEAKTPTQSKRIGLGIKRPNILQVKCAANTQERVGHGERALEVDHIAP